MTRIPDEILERFARGESDLTERILVEAHLRLRPESEARVRSAVENDPEIAEWGAFVEAERNARSGPSPEGVPGLPPSLLKRVQSGSPDSPSAGPGRKVRDSDIPLADDLLDELRPRREWQWMSLWPCRGRIALVKTDPGSGSALYCALFEAGSPAPRHRHLFREEALVLTGAYRYGEVLVRAGDYDLKEAGTEHAPRVLPGEDCWLLIRQGAPRSPLFTGPSLWRRPFVALARRAGIPGA